MGASTLAEGQTFRADFQALLDRLEPDAVRSHAFLAVPCDRKPWLDSGIDLAAGEQLTSFAAGRTCLDGTGLWFGTDFQLWFRIGEDGEIFRGTRASHSFTADRPGRLYLASYFPGEWASRDGALATPDEVYAQASGELAALILRWPGEAIDGLRRLARLGDVDGLIAGEIDRLSHPAPPPEGWRYLWFVGPAEIYRPALAPGRKPAIACHTRHDAGLLQKDLSLPLRPDTCLRWAWRVDALPSPVREDLLATHDYLSIAVEFDDGQDITYYWSAELPKGTAYRCPIPSWTGRETHVVVRSGAQGLGEWQSEQRNLFEDYQAFIGHPAPAHIVRVWLIAVSLFQRREGRCEYAGIELLSGGETFPVE
jgi:hypothetical protein